MSDFAFIDKVSPVKIYNLIGILDATAPILTTLVGGSSSDLHLTRLIVAPDRRSEPKSCTSRRETSGGSG